MKYHLRRTMGSQRWTFEELSTCVTQIEAILIQDRCVLNHPITVIWTPLRPPTFWSANL